MPSLTDSKCKTLPEGLHSDGQGLYLRVQKTGKSFIIRWTDKDKKRKTKVLGKYGDNAMSLKQARREVSEFMDAINSNQTPQSLRSGIPTFGEYAEKYITEMESGWSNSKHRAQWRSTVLGSKNGPDYCKKLRGIPVDEITTDDVLEVLSPYWLTKHETMSRLRGRIEKILGHATVKKLRTGLNPAVYNGHLEYLLPKYTKTKSHHAAMPYKDAPAFVQTTLNTSIRSHQALLFTILTAARAGEVRFMKWSEIDFEAKLWTVPANRMKARREHVVTLTDAAIKCVGDPQADDDLVFFGHYGDRPFSDMTLLKIMRDNGLDATVHGFRSTFRDWAGDETTHERDIVELALAHTIANKVEAAYRRSTALDKRRSLMNDWADYLLGVHGG